MAFFFLKLRFLFFFSDFNSASHSLNLQEILEELFRLGDGSYLVEMDNFVTEIHTDQGDFQVVLRETMNEDEPRLGEPGLLQRPHMR